MPFLTLQLFMMHMISTPDALVFQVRYNIRMIARPALPVPDTVTVKIACQYNVPVI
jgi:hypothetical protein